MCGVAVAMPYIFVANKKKKCYNQSRILSVVEEEVHENNYYYSAYTISSPYKWYGWFLDRLGIIRIRSGAGK